MKTPKTQTNNPNRQRRFAEVTGSAADSDGEEMPKEQEALAAGLALVDAKWDGESDFDKGMRLLQQKLGISDKPQNAKLTHREQ